MAAPALQERVIGTTVTNGLTSTVTPVAGDLVVFTFTTNVATGGTPLLTLYRGATPITGAQNLSPVLSDVDTAGARWAYLFAVVLPSSPGGTITGQVSNFPATGTNRRQAMWIVRPATGTTFDNATPERTMSYPASGAHITSGYTSPAYGQPWSASYSGSNQGSVAICTQFSNASGALSVDFDDGSGASFEATDGSPDTFGGASGTYIHHYGEAFTGNALGSTANIGFSAQRTTSTTMVTVAAYWVTVAASNPIACVGTGTLTATGRRGRYGAAALTGTGTTSATGLTAGKRGAAALTGTGALAAAAHVGRRAPGRARTITSAWSDKYGEGYARRGPGRSRTVTWSGATGRLGKSRAAALTGTGTFTATGKRVVFRGAALTGTGTLTAGGHLPGRGTALLTGTGTLTAAGLRVRHGAAALTGTGTSSATGSLTLVKYATAHLAGTGTLTAHAGVEVLIVGTATDGIHAATAVDGIAVADFSEV